MTEPTTEDLLEQLRASYVDPPPHRPAALPEGTTVMVGRRVVGVLGKARCVLTDIPVEHCRCHVHDPDSVTFVVPSRGGQT